jgi:hypothetical protein
MSIEREVGIALGGLDAARGRRFDLERIGGFTGGGIATRIGLGHSNGYCSYGCRVHGRNGNDVPATFLFWR